MPTHLNSTKYKLIKYTINWVFKTNIAWFNALGQQTSQPANHVSTYNPITYQDYVEMGSQDQLLSRAYQKALIRLQTEQNPLSSSTSGGSSFGFIELVRSASGIKTINIG
jgi:hypothetical protein